MPTQVWAVATSIGWAVIVGVIMLYLIFSPSTEAGIFSPSSLRCFSSAAISVVILRDHPSAVLKATMRTGQL